MNRDPHRSIAQRIAVTVPIQARRRGDHTFFGGFPGEAQDTANDVYASQLAIDAMAGYLCGWHRAAAPQYEFPAGVVLPDRSVGVPASVEWSAAKVGFYLAAFPAGLDTASVL